MSIDKQRKLDEVKTHSTDSNVLRKSDLISFIQHTEGLSANKAKSVVKNVFKWISIHLAQGKKVSIKDFGSLYASYVKETYTTHPSSKAKIYIDERVRLIFKPEKKTKDLIQAALPYIKPDKSDE